MMHAAAGRSSLHCGLLVLVLGLSTSALVHVQAQSGDRQPGAVRTLTDQTDATQCYQLGQADQAQDQAAGIRLDLSSAMAGADGDNLVTRYTEDGRPVAAAIAVGATTKACIQGYLGGYVGDPPAPP